MTCPLCEALAGHLAYLREAVADAIGYDATGNVRDVDRELVDRLDARLAAAYADGYRAGAAATQPVDWKQKAAGDE